MTVRDLIKSLADMNPDATVLAGTHDNASPAVRLLYHCPKGSNSFARADFVTILGKLTPLDDPSPDPLQNSH